MSTGTALLIFICSMIFGGAFMFWFSCVFTVCNVKLKNWEVEDKKKYNFILKVATFGKSTKQ
jgi:hypothetical protein